MFDLLVLEILFFCKTYKLTSFGILFEKKNVKTAYIVSFYVFFVLFSIFGKNKEAIHFYTYK